MSGIGQLESSSKDPIGLLEITLLVTSGAGFSNQGLPLAQSSFYNTILTERWSKEETK